MSCIVLMDKTLCNGTVNSCYGDLVGLAYCCLILLRYCCVKLLKTCLKLRFLGLVSRILNLCELNTLLR